MADLEHVVAVIERGEHGAIRIARKTFNGSAPYTDVRFFYKDEAGELKPTGKGTSVRDSELANVIDALQRIWRKIEGGGAEPRVTRSSSSQRSLPAGTTQNRPVSDEAARAQAEEDGRLF